MLPGVSAAAARAMVAYSCGVSQPFAGCMPEDMRVVRRMLQSGFPTKELGAHTSAIPHTKEIAGVPNGAAPRVRAGSSRLAHTILVLLSWLCVIAISIAAYQPTLSNNMEVGGFFMDDAMIKKNTVVTDVSLDWHRLMRTDYWGLDMFDPNTWTHKSFRPLTILTFRWNYLMHGFNSVGFHVTNVLMHTAASVQFVFFGRTVLHLPWVWSAMLASLFAVHPVHTESICYVVGRADLLCAQVLLMAISMYRPGLSAGPLGWIRLSVGFALIVAAGLCKETGFTFFGFLVVAEIMWITRTKRFYSCLLGWLRVLMQLLVGAGACWARVRYTSGTQIARMDPYSNPVAASEDPHVRRLSYALVHGMYMKLLVWPSFLCYDYSMDAVPLVQSVADLRLLLPCSAYLGFMMVVCIAARRLRAHAFHARIRAEGLALAVLVFTLSFLPMTNLLFPVGTLVAERLLYLPSMGFIAAAVSWAYSETTSSLSAKGRIIKSRLAWSIMICTLSVWWYLCFKRVQDWQSVQQLTLVDGLKQLRSSRTQFNLANIYLLESRLDEALLAYQRSIATDPLERDSQPLYHAGQILLYRGQYTEAEGYLHKAVSGYFSPLTLAEEEVWHDYGLALWHVGRSAESVHNFQNALITNPTFPKGLNNHGCSLVLLGLSSQPPQVQLVQQGLGSMEQAIAMVPQSPLYWRNAAALLTMIGDTQAALQAWERYRQLDPIGGSGAIPNDCKWEFYFR